MIEKTIPDYIIEGGEHAVKLYKEYLEADERLYSFNERYQIVETGDNETVTVDLLGVWSVIEHKLKKNDVKREEIIRIKAIYKDISVLKANKARLKKAWFKVIHRGRKPVTPLEIKRSDLLNMFAAFYTSHEVKEIFSKDYGYKIDLNSINRFAYDNRKEIERLRKEKIATNQNLRIAQETGRLEILSEIHFYYYRRWQKDKNPADSKMCMFILEQARKEVKGNEVKLTIDGKIDINTSLHGQTNINKLLPRLNINLLVIALTAHKNGVNSLGLLDDLINGYYSKFTGIASEPPTEVKKEDIIYPSSFIRSYDWAKIDTLHKEKERQKKMIVGSESEVKELKDTGKKDMLFEYLKNIKEKNR